MPPPWAPLNAFDSDKSPRRVSVVRPPRPRLKSLLTPVAVPAGKYKKKSRSRKNTKISRRDNNNSNITILYIVCGRSVFFLDSERIRKSIGLLMRARVFFMFFCCSPSTVRPKILLRSKSDNRDCHSLFYCVDIILFFV